MIKKAIFSLSLFLSALLNAEVFEIDRIDDVRHHIAEDTLYLFDIDDTLIDTSSTLGSTVWRHWAKPKTPRLDTSFKPYDALTLYIAKKIPYRTVEPSTASLISDLQKDGHPVLAFTARGKTEWYSTEVPGVDRFTHKQLTSVGIDFTKTEIPTELHAIDKTYFYNGIIFAKHNSKGELLKQLLQELDYTPSMIVFVDDRLDQVLSVDAAAEEMGIPFKGFWYTRAEADRKDWNPMATNIQLEALLINDKIVSDEDAAKQAEAKQNEDPIAYYKSILERINGAQIAP